MKKIVLFLIIFLFSSFYFYYSNADFSDIIGWGNKIIYCQWDSCWLDKWVDLVREELDDWIRKDEKASVYIQQVVVYILWFVTLIAVLYIIYAWFMILTSAWDTDKREKQKKILISVFIWILVIWLSYAIVNFIISILDRS